ncbi:hypothetical protein Tco_1308166, partial [Tanacetum coccineum]
SSNYDDNSVNRIDIIDVACEEYSKEVLGFSVSGNPTPSTELIVLPLLLLSLPLGIDSYYDSEGDILLLEKFLNVDPSSPPLPPQELKVVEPKNEKSLIDETPVIIAKDLKDEEKAALIKVLKSHKRALAWKLSDIKVTSKFPSTLKIKKKPHSRVLMERSPIVACLLAYAMHRARSKGV